VTKFSNGADSNVSIGNNNSLVNAESRRHNMMLDTAIVPVFTPYISFKSSNQIDVKI
jgi:hypothetical protein